MAENKATFLWNSNRKVSSNNSAPFFYNNGIGHCIIKTGNQNGFSFHSILPAIVFKGKLVSWTGKKHVTFYEKLNRWIAWLEKVKRFSCQCNLLKRGKRLGKTCS